MEQRSEFTNDLYSNVLCLALQPFLNLEAFDSNRSFDWINHTVSPIRSCVVFYLIKKKEKKKKKKKRKKKKKKS